MRSLRHPPLQNLSAITNAVMNGCVAWFLPYCCIHTVISCLVILHLADTDPDMNPSSFQVNLILSSDHLMREFLMRLASERSFPDECWQRLWLIFEPGDGVLHPYFLSYRLNNHSPGLLLPFWHNCSQCIWCYLKKKSIFSPAPDVCKNIEGAAGTCDVLQILGGNEWSWKQIQSPQINLWLKIKSLEFTFNIVPWKTKEKKKGSYNALYSYNAGSLLFLILPVLLPYSDSLNEHAHKIQ